MAKRAIKNNKRAKPVAKYVFRRFMLVLFLVFLVLGGCVLLGYKLAVMGKNQSLSGVSSVASVSPVPDETGSGASDPNSEEVSRSGLSDSKPDKKTADENEEDWRLLLVNKKHPVPEGYGINLVKIVDDYKVDDRISDPLLKMIAGAREDGITLIICSAYRSYEKQEQLFENKKNELMSGGLDEDEAVMTTATIITTPGTSEHHTGLAVDIVAKGYESLDEGFENTTAFKWLNDHAAGYGFIMRYPKDKTDITDIIYEPWHYRYVGIENANEISANNWCLEEYVSILEQRKQQPETSGNDSAEAEESGSQSEE